MKIIKLHKISINQHYVDGVMGEAENLDNLPFDNMFGKGRYRTVIPLKNEKLDIIIKKAILSHYKA